MSDASIRAVLITGTVGSGKTAVAQEAGALLGDRGRPTAVIDLDWLGWAHGLEGHPADELIATNLRSVWANYRSAGARYFVMTRAVHTADQVDAIRTVVDADMKIVAIEASVETITERLRARDAGAELSEHLDRAPRLAAAIAELDVDHRIANEGRAIEDVAKELLERVGWI